jgi:competence ComEA-like helix-hairpin-helix protein
MTRMIAFTVMALVLGVAVASAQGGSARPAPAVSAGAPVNLNSASVPQLEALPGIGKATAERIVEYREKNGGFKKVEEILETSRSPLILLRMVPFGHPPAVSESRKKSQEISG